MSSEQVDQIMAFLAWEGAGFVAGVGFAAYRSIGWTERIRKWAHTVPIADQEVDPMGVE